MARWSDDELVKELQRFRYWYHKIQLSPSITTPGREMDVLWNHVRAVRSHVDYKDKAVLDIASFDGLFAFEAESLGASRVVATDCLYRTFDNFMFCREVLGSRAIPYYNISPYNLVDRLDVLLDENYGDEVNPHDRRFDIVQHFGLLYHLRDPMLSLSQARSVLKPGGQLIIESDVVMGVDDSFMLFNGLPNASRVRDNYSVWWAPTKTCLFEMLEATMFRVRKETYSEFYYEPPATPGGQVQHAQSMPSTKSPHRIGRGAVVAEAVPLGTSHPKFETEVTRTYRNPGLDPRRIGF